MTSSLKKRRRVPPQLAGGRLDKVLVELFAGTSRSKFQNWIRAGRVRVAGQVEQSAKTPVEAGVELELDLERPAEAPRATVEQARQQLKVLYEDEQLLAIDKPAGLLTHHADNRPETSLAELADAIFGPLPSSQGSVDRPGIVHRLDRDTSGVIVLGRDEASIEELQRQFREREVEKSYLALVHEEPRFDTDWIEGPLGRAPRQPDRMAVVPEGQGRDARTYYEVRERFGDFALLDCRPHTGRTHQIRVHLSSIGFPIVGDSLYRRRNVPRRPIPPQAPPADRQLLHARRIRFRHPASGEAMEFCAPIPDDFQHFVDWLRAR